MNVDRERQPLREGGPDDASRHDRARQQPEPDLPGRAANGQGSRVRSWAWRGVQVALIAAVTWGVYRTLAPELSRLSWTQVKQLGVAPAPLALSTLILAGVYVAHAFLWRRIMGDLEIGRPVAKDTLRVYFVASLGRYLPGKLWQLAGLAVLAARAGLSAGGAAAAAVIGQIAFLATGVVFLALLLPRLASGTGAVAVAAVLAVAGITGWALIATRRGRAGARWLLERAPARTRPPLRSAATFAARVRSRAALTWAAGYALTWIALGLAFTLFVSAFVPDSLGAARYLAGTVAASYLWGYAMVIAPAGLGVREIAMGGLLAQIPGFPVAAVVAVPVASRIWFTAAELLPLALVPILPAAPSRDPTAKRQHPEEPETKSSDVEPTPAPGTTSLVPADTGSTDQNPTDEAIAARLSDSNAERGLVITPTYNERKNLARLVELVLAQDPRLDILIIDDASPDGTGHVADDLARDNGRVHVVHRAGKLGLGTAYLEGFRWGLDRGYAWLFEMDADFSHDPAHLPQFLKAIEQYDVVLGSRYLDGRITVVNWPVGRLLLSYFANVYARLVTGLPVADATSGYKCFRRAAIQAIELERVESEGYAFQIEMSLRAWKKGFRIGEIPIVFVDRTAGESKMSKRIIREAVWKVWKLRALTMLGKL